MTISRGDPEWLDPFELVDLYGQGSVDPATAAGLANAASHLGHVLYGHMVGTIRRYLDDTDPTPSDPLLQRSGRQSLSVQLRACSELLAESDRRLSLVYSAVPGSEEQVGHVLWIQDTVAKLQEARDSVLPALLAAATARARESETPPAPPVLLTVDKAIEATKQDLLRMRNRTRVDGEKPSLLVLGTTPGSGKTEVMAEEARRTQSSGGRVLILARTKSMIRGPEAELPKRIDFHGHLDVIPLYGRDGYVDPLWGATCYQPEAVELSMKQGYAPGRAVCAACEHFPANVQDSGKRICWYYQSRINAHHLARAAATGRRRHYPILLSTHALGVAIARPGGAGRYGQVFATPDLVLVDEDPTDAMRPDVTLTEEQCLFTAGGDAFRKPAEFIAKLLFQGIVLARKARKNSKDKGFLHQPIHSNHGSVYRAEQLHNLLRAAADQEGSDLGALLAQVTTTGRQGFSVTAGDLSYVVNQATINAMHIPPVPLLTVAEALNDELHHVHHITRAVAERMSPPKNSNPFAITADAAAQRQAEHVAPDLRPAYTLRLECIPRNAAKGQAADVWRYVVKEEYPIASGDSDVIIGDAYAIPEHYERLFPGHRVQVVKHVAMLHPDTTVVRVVDNKCSITRLEGGELSRVLGMMEAHIDEHYQPGQRILVYGHQQLRNRVEPLLRGIAERHDIALENIVFEHWWGGRGKDKYYGWEWLYTISDPTSNLNGIEHEVNAQRFRHSDRLYRAGNIDEFLDNAERVEIMSCNYGTTSALSRSDKLLKTEAFRQNSAEMVQAVHRGRPARAPVGIVMFGNTPLTPDLVAQTAQLVEGGVAQSVGSTYPGKTRSNSPGEYFSTTQEALETVEAIVHWFGVFSPWFAHALLRYQTKSGPNLLRSLTGSGRIYFDTPVRRVWDPPVHWWRLKDRDTLPKPIREALRQLPGTYASLEPSRWPSWLGRQRGRKPLVFFDPNICSAQEAERLHWEIVENQYGPVIEVGDPPVRRLHRPNFNPNPPTSIQAYRESPPF